MSSGWFQNWLRGQVVERLEGVTGGRVEIGYFRFRPLLLQVILQRLVIHGTEPAGAAPLISIAEADVGLVPEQLLRRRLRLRHVDLNQLQVHLRMTSDGQSNLPVRRQQASPQQDLSDLMNLSIARLTITHSAIFWNDSRQAVEIGAQEMAVLLSMQHGRYSGALSSPRTTVSAPQWALPPLGFSSRFELSASRLNVTSLAWQSNGISGEASFAVRAGPRIEANGAYHTAMDVAALGRLLHAPQFRAGGLVLDGRVAYQDGALSAVGHTEARQVSIVLPPLPTQRIDLGADYGLENRHLKFTNLITSIWGGKVEGTLEANFAASPVEYHLDSRLYRVQLEDLLRPATAAIGPVAQLHPVASASGSLGASWSGLWQGMEANFDLSLEGPASPPSHLLPVSGRVQGSLEDGRGLIVHLDDAKFQTPHSTITAHGALTERTPAAGSTEPLALTVSTDNFEEWQPFFQALLESPTPLPLELSARAEFAGQLGGTYGAPSLAGRLTLGAFRYEGGAWDRLTANVSLNPGRVKILSARVEHQRSSLELTGTADLEDWRLVPGSEVQLSAQAQRTIVEDLRAAIHSDFPLRGYLSGHLDMQGTAAALAGSGVLRVDDGELYGEPFHELSAQVRVEQSVWKLQAIQLTKDGGRLTGDLDIDANRHFVSGQMEGTGFNLSGIRRLSAATTLSAPARRLDGDLSFTARGQGTTQNFQLQSTWRIQNLRAAGTPLGEFRSTLTGAGNQLTLEGDDQGPGGSLHLGAKATAQGDWPMEAQGEFSGLRADPWIRTFFNRQFGGELTIAGSFRAEGPLHTPEKITLESHARDVAIDFPSIQWRNVEPLDVRYAGGKLAFDRFVLKGPSTELGIQGAVLFNGGAALALQVEGTANATLLTMLDANVQATGRSTLSLRLTGTPAQPLMNGTLTVQDVSLGYEGLPSRFTDLKGTIDLQGERALIRNLSGASGGGTVSFGGFATFSESPRVELRADLSQVRVRYPTSFTSVFDGHVRLSGTPDHSQLTGDLVVRQMVLNENVNFIAKIIESSNPLPAQTVSINSPLAAKMRLNVRVTSAPPVQLQVPNLRVVGDIDLRMQGTVAEPVMVGGIHLLSGESVFRGNRYTLTRGDISMTNPFRTQPYLDLEAETRVQSYDLTLDISGPFDRLKFSYRSDPPLANSDILSLLALGYVQEEQAFSTAGGNPAASIGASAILSEALSSQTTSRIQRLFGVSRIKIDPNVAVPGFGSGARVTIEQQVTSNLTLTYVTDTSYSQYQIIQFEWNISDKMSILGIRDQNGVLGMEIRFRRRFK